MGNGFPQKKPLAPGTYKGSLKKNEDPNLHWVVMKGSIVIDGVSYWVDVSRKQTSQYGEGEEYWPLQLKRKQEQHAPMRQHTGQALKPLLQKMPADDVPFDDEIPY